jgi:hypothetical protein
MTAEGPIDFDQLADDIRRANEAWVELDHASRLLTATKEIVKAQLILKQRTRQGGSEKHLRLAVEASAEWSDYVLAEVTARTKANAALVALALAKTRHDGGRSANAARNAEIKHLGG